MNPHDLVLAVLVGDDLRARQWLKDAKVEHFSWANAPAPQFADESERAVYAALVELFAGRTGARAPSWTAGVGKAPTPVVLLRRARRSPRLMKMLEAEAPDVLRRHNVFASANYLDML